MSFEDLMKGLRKEYLASLPQKIHSLEQNLASQSATGLREVFHKLKGTGKTYGFPEVSELAEVAESVCLEMPQEAVMGAAQAVQVLKDIHKCRAQGQEFDLNADSRFHSLRKILLT